MSSPAEGEESILVLIPAYNEAPRIGAVVAGVRRALTRAEVVVIDDGSSDGTARQARAAGATVLSLPMNLGYGDALRTGYEYALASGAQVVVQLDADGQHDPSSITTLLDAMADRDAGVVIGCRFAGSGDYRMPMLRRIGSRLFSAILRLLTGRRFHDPTSGFQAIRRSALRFFATDNLPGDYPDADFIYFLCRSGIEVVEAPARFEPSPDGKRTLHEGLLSVFYVAKMLLSVFLTMLRPLPDRSAGAEEEE